MFIRRGDKSEVGFLDPVLDMAEDNIASDKEFVKSIIIPEKARVLDIGYGLARDLQYIQSINPSAELHGLEINDYTYKLKLNNVTFVKASVLSIPYPDGYFDVVYANSIFTELTDSEVTAAIAEMQRVGGDYYYVEIDMDRTFTRFKNGNRWA